MQSFAALKRRTTNLLLPSRSISGTWQKIDGIAPPPRSSHSLDVVGGSAYIFGGEIDACGPVDNDMHVIGLPYSGASADYYNIPARPLKNATKTTPTPPHPAKDLLSGDEGSGNSANESNDDGDNANRNLADIPLCLSPTNLTAAETGKNVEERPALEDVPSPRIGHATAVIGNRIFMFGGCGGPAMIPLDEGGRVWIFETRLGRWSYLDPVSPNPDAEKIPRPAPRSYHAAVSLTTPRDFKPLGPKGKKTWSEWAAGDSAEVGTLQSPIGSIAEKATDEDDDGFGTFIIHGGCLADTGQRVADIWAFDVRSRIWQQLPAAPGPPRGGAALCVSGSRLFRFGGYDGKGEIGGRIDILQLRENHSGLEPTIGPKGEWLTLTQPTTTNDKSLVSNQWPKPRSATKMVPLVSGGKKMIVLFMGQGEASTMGYSGAGKFFDDVWVLQIPSKSATSSTEVKWSQVNTNPRDDDESDEMPKPRGWMDAASMTEIEENAIIMWGGLGGVNMRMGDGWIFRLE